jgi:Zn-dependent peptidase ImmA (M78 family)
MEHNTYDPYRIADNLGIDYKYVQLGDNQLGMTVIFDSEPIILLNADLSESFRRFEVMAHELSHALCHADLPHYYDRAIHGKLKLEKEADKFAAVLLTGLFLQEFGKPACCFRELKNIFLLEDSAMKHYI